MPERYAAFVSYAHRYKDWVAQLQRNLETSLRAAGASLGEWRRESPFAGGNRRVRRAS